MNLNGLTIYAGHDNANAPYSSSYVNNCDVKYFKYFANSICSDAEISTHRDCSADGCAELNLPGTCDTATVEGHGPFSHTFTAADGDSGYAYSTMAWVKCSNLNGNWANIWHLSPHNANYNRNPAIWLNMGSRYIHACFTNANSGNGNVILNSSSSIIEFD